jgi:hypothetical protein
MKLANNNVLLFALTTSLASAQECIDGGWAIEFEGKCNYENILDAYTHQVYNGVTGAETCGDDATSAADDLNAKLALANITIASLCQSVYDDAKATRTVPFTDAANKGDDLHFESMFYNGRSIWQEEVETEFETEDGGRTSVLKQDAEAVRDFYEGVAEHEPVAWPGSLPNFQSPVTDSQGNPTCRTGAAMCVWPKDRQANDNNGNCAKPYDINCVDKDPADNTNLCFVDSSRGPNSNEFESDKGLYMFPGDNNDGEGAIHCHGFAWSNDVDHPSARFRGNNLFYVSMYDHMYVRGYVKNIPGAPMCGCVEQMPTVSRCDCTQIDLEETIKITYDSRSNLFNGRITDISIDFNACQGINNRNNDLWAYIARLYQEEEITNEQFGEAGRIITDDGCSEASIYELNKNNYTLGYAHDEDTWTFVAGRDALDYHDGYGNKAFSKAMETASSSAPNGILYRVCPGCIDTHRKIYYRRLTPIPESFDLLQNILYRTTNGDGHNVWGEDFSLHSTYEDALTGANPWKCPGDNYDYGRGFPGRCSPSGAQVKNQEGRFNEHNEQKNIGFYVNKPESEKLQVVPTNIIAGHEWADGTTILDDDGTIYLTGSGNDIWDKADAFNYYSHPASGRDQTVIVNLSSQSHIWFNMWSKAGIMFRLGLEPDSPHVFVYLSGSEGICMQSRTGDYYGIPGDMRTTHFGCKKKGATSAWLKLEKRIDTFTSFYGTDDGAGNISWTEMYSVEAPRIGEEFNVGLAACSRRWVPFEAVFEKYSVEEFFFPSAAPSVSSAPSSFSEDITDVGEVTFPGSFMKSNAGYFKAIGGSGYDIWGTKDSFHLFDKQEVTGDVSIEMLVESFETQDWYGKGGLMIRESLAANSKHFSVFLTKEGNRMTSVFRSSTNGLTASDKNPSVYDRHIYIKLTKTGNVFKSFFRKLDQADWTQIGATRTITFTNDFFYVGIAISAHDTNQVAELNARDLVINGNIHKFPSAAPTVSSAPSSYGE